MVLTQGQGRVVGVVVAVVILCAIAGVGIYWLRSPEEKVVVVEPDGPAPDASAPEAAPVAATVEGPAGVVVDADGSPVARAEVLLATANTMIDVHSTVRRNTPSVRSDEEGRFAFGQVPAWVELAVCCSQGFAHVRSGEMPADGRIVLQPWGRIEGVLRVGREVAANQTIRLRQMMPRVVASTNPSRPVRIASSAGHLSIGQTTRTDENGRFVFARVVPGIATLMREVPRPIQGSRGFVDILPIAHIDVPAGQTIQVEIGGKGRPVVGRVVIDGSEESLAFSGTIHLMRNPQAMGGPRVPENWAALSEHERAAFADDWYRWWLSAVDAPVTVASDGSFRAEDIPPGQHMLSVVSQQLDPQVRSVELVAEGMLVFTMPPIPEGRSDEPLDVGTVTARLRPRVKVGSPAPGLEAAGGDGRVVKLSDYRGKYVVLGFFFDHGTSRMPDPADFAPLAGAMKDRAGGEDRLAMVAVMLPEGQAAKSYELPAVPGWTVAAMNEWREQLDESYRSSLGAYLIDPEGTVLARLTQFEQSGYGILDRALGLMRAQGPGVAVVMEKIPAEGASPAFAFQTIPTISKDDAGQSATFRVVDGQKANFGGAVHILNDGLGPRNERDEVLMCTFMPRTVEGRIRADLGKTIAVEQINSYAWYKDSHRWAQVYRVYGSDGSGVHFNPEPKIGTDPASCGWSLIAAVDTRETPGGTDLRDDVRGQSGVSIRGENGAMGKYRYLLFVTFATETHNMWGQTFWSEIDVVGR